MKNFILPFTLLISFYSFAQIEGTWNGAIEIPGNKLPFVVHITKENGELKATSDSPNQNAYGLEMSSIRFENNTLHLSQDQMRMTYEGTLTDQQNIMGTFKQGTYSFPLNLTKGALKINRPQEPKAPFTYNADDITFENKKAGIKLAGTLTSPKEKGKYPAVILVSGSGPQDRDETIMGHKPFLLLADYLTQNGYVVLRYDDRGVANSEGDFSDATTSDFATDTEAAVEFLKKQKNIDPKKIGILGHSEGALVAQIIAAKTKDVAFIISMAGPAVEIDKLMITQKAEMERASGIPELAIKMNEKVFGDVYKILKKDSTNQEAKNEIVAYLKNDPVYKNVSEKEIQSLVNQVLDKWFRAFISYNPKENLSKISSKVLALNGEKDLQVLAKENLEGWKNGLLHNKNVTVKSYPDLNHMFQKANTGLIDEYGTIETTIEPFVLEDIVNWLNENVK